jgi:hypothetical protein
MESIMSSSDQNCPLCKDANATVSQVSLIPGKSRIRCRRCGDYEIVGEAVIAIEQRNDAHLLSGLTREMTDRQAIQQSSQKEQRQPLQIVTGLDPKELDAIVAQAPGDLDIATKVRKLLAAISRRSRHPGDMVQIAGDTDFPLAFARNSEELHYIIGYAIDMDWITDDARTFRTRNGDTSCCLTPKGWEEVQRPGRVDSTTAFVAMWFDQTVSDAYKVGMKPAIENDCGYRSDRVDLEDTNNDDIVDEILAQITASRFVVADVTGHRQAVYFEAGFAKGLGIPVIWTCRESDFKDERTFDTEHYNHILWNLPEELRKKLANRIKNSIDVGTAR